MREARTKSHSAPLLLQERGALIGVDPKREKIVLVSKNVGTFFPTVDPAGLIGCNLQCVLDKEVVHALRNALPQASLNWRRQYLGDFSVGGQQVELHCFLDNGTLIVEFLPAAHGQAPSALTVFKDTGVLLDALLDPSVEQVGFRRFAALLAAGSGYHYVAIERANGETYERIAVSGRVALAADIGSRAGQLNYVYDLTQPSTELVATTGFDVPSLMMSALRLPEQGQSDRLVAKGIRAIASIGFKREGRDLGRIVFAHAAPRVPSLRFRFALAHVSPTVNQVFAANW